MYVLVLMYGEMGCSVVQCVAVCCSMLQCVAVCCSVLQCGAVCCSALQCVAVCCSVCVSEVVIIPGKIQYNYAHNAIMCIQRGWRRVINCLILIGHSPQKSPRISGIFATNDPQLTASYESSPPCSDHYGVATIGKLLKIIGLFCKRAL